MIELDVKDKKILYELDLNARQSDSEIAKKVKLSREVVSYRINKLVKEGVIREFVTVLNHNALGYLAFRIFLKFKDVTPQKEEAIVAFLKDKVAWIVRVRGNWTFNTMIFTKNAFEVEKLLNNLKKQFQDNLIQIHSSIITKMHHYHRSYFVGKEEKESVCVTTGEETTIVQLDDIDEKILRAIESNARLSSIEIATKIKSSERIVRYRLKNLIKNRVILGFRAIPNLSVLGMYYYKIHAKLNKFDDEHIRNLIYYIGLQPNIVYRTETIGGWDLEIEVQINSSKELYELLDKIIKEFPGLIEDYDVLEYAREYKLSYLNTA